MSVPRPVVLLGEFTGRRVPRIQALGWGRLWIGRNPSAYPGEPWGCDNGAYRDYLAGGRGVNVPRFLRHVENCQRRLGTPYLAVAPDIVAGGLESLEYSLDWLGRLPPDWPWYLAVQDGQTPADVEPVATRFAGIFLGGTAEWKWLTARVWRNFSRAHGLRLHYARAGTPRKLQHAIDVEADSLDSAFPMWTHERWTSFEYWWVHQQWSLPLRQPCGGLA